ncbi:MAG: alpha-galactosidase [Clostridia bacterium]|nr:alpha-galactosidase [Clostridia bacterium]
MDRRLFDNEFKDIYLNEDPYGQPVFCYRTGMTVYEEIFDKNRLVSAGWNTAGTPLNVLEGMPFRLDYDAFAAPWSFDVEAGGETLSYDWKYIGFEKRTETLENGAGVLHGVVTLENMRQPLTVEVHTVLSGSAVFTRYLTLCNRSDAPMKISRLAPMCGGLEQFHDWAHFVDGESGKERLYRLGYMENANGCAEGLFRWHPMVSGGMHIAGRWRSERHRFPMFMIRNVPLGKIWFAQMAYSGGFLFSFDLDADASPNGISDRGDRYRAGLSFRMEADGPAPLLVLDPGETFTSPEICIGCVQGDLDDAVNMMHKHTRRAVFTFPETPDQIATVGAGIGPERAMTPEAIFHTIRTAAAVGAESCIVDAGWNCPAGKEGSDWGGRVGDWTPDPGKHADKFAAIRLKCEENGLRFGLWMECERMGAGTPVAEAHPDWYQQRYLNGCRTELIDLTNPEALAWVRSEVARVITEYGVGLFRIDYNVGAAGMLCKRDHNGQTENIWLRYYRAVYDMFASLRRQFPQVVFENCAGGGGRADLGMVKQFTHTWVSDYQIPPRSLAITNGMTMVLPPERVDRLVSGMNGHLRASLDFTVRSTLMAKPTTNTYNPLGSATDPQALAFVRHSFDLYKSFIRPYLTDGYIYHHTPELYENNPRGRGIIERASVDGTKGVIGVFNLADISPDDPAVTVYPRGLDASKTFTVTYDNTGASATVEGWRLVNEGVRVYLPASLTSELLIFEAKEEA